MGLKRGISGLSFLVGVNKPVGLSSHDVVNRVRRIFGEGRVGHTGTLDPAACGVLLVCVGPATRLDNYLVGHSKHYVTRICFGSATSTDDAEGEIISNKPVPHRVLDKGFASTYVSGMCGRHQQIPPVYSAIKVEGTRAYAKARTGVSVDLKPRDIEVFNAALLDVCVKENNVYWDVSLHVSSGTYVRAIARDIGLDLGTVAHVGTLKRTSVGKLTLESCVTLEELEEIGLQAAVNPLPLLGMRFSFVSNALEERIKNGNSIPASMQLFEIVNDNTSCAFAESQQAPKLGEQRKARGNNSFVFTESQQAPKPGEHIALIGGACGSGGGINTPNEVFGAEQKSLRAIYEFDRTSNEYQAKCVFSTPVMLGDHRKTQ